MAADENTARIRRLYEEAFNRGNMAVIDEVIAPDHRDHAADPERSPGSEGVREFVRLVRAEWPDFHLSVEDQVAEGDKVVTRWTARGTHTQAVATPYGSVAPTNKPVTVTGISIDRFDGGKVAESWTRQDDLGLMQQLGAVATLAVATR